MSGGIITISDVVIGYGSPQILRFTESLTSFFNLSGLILQPLVPSRPILNISNLPSLSVRTIPTALHPWSWNGLDEYHRQCADIINENKPLVLLLANYTMLPILDYLAEKPKHVVLLSLEDFDQFSASKIPRIDKFKIYVNQVDKWIFPEFNRAVKDSAILEVPFSKISIMYNVSENNFQNREQRNGRIIYAGTLNRESSVGKYIFERDVGNFNIDLYGEINNMDSQFDNMNKNISRRTRFFGQVSLQHLEQCLPSYSYSLVFWMPLTHSLLNAAPNKFFQAICNGVPAVTTPHPQTKMLVERYGCGIVLDGWSKQDLIKGLRKAESLFGTSAYERMVQGCQRAIESELNWNAQFEKFSKRFSVEN